MFCLGHVVICHLQITNGVKDTDLLTSTNEQTSNKGRIAQIFGVFVVLI